MAEKRQRVLSIDLARGLAVFFMIGVHALITFGAPETRDSAFGYVVGFFGSPPAAPVFMALMGISFYYSRNTDMAKGIKRGIKIIALGYGLNILRGVLPVLVAKTILPHAALGIPVAVADCWDAFFEIDILQFAGLSLIIMAIIRRYEVDKYLLLTLAVVIAAVSPLFWGVSIHFPPVDHLLDYLWGNKPSVEPCIGNLVSFPFFPWFSYVLVGMFMGNLLSQSANPAKVIKRAGAVGIVLMLVGSALLYPDVGTHLGDYYHSTGVAVLFITGFVLAWIALCEVVVEHVKMNCVFEVLFYWSKHVNIIYLIQWTLIMWVADLAVGFYQCSILATTGLIIALTIVTHYTAALYLKLKDREYE